MITFADPVGVPVPASTPSFLAALIRRVDGPGLETLGVDPQIADDVAGEADGVGLVVDGEVGR